MQAQNLPVSKMARFAQSSRSLFDFASRVPNVARVTLRHQYRSAGPIVEYISDYFYSGQLQTSYDPAGLVVPKNARPGLAWENVPSPAIPQNGNVNAAEVSAILRHLRLLLEEQVSGQRRRDNTVPRASDGVAGSARGIPEQKRTAADLKRVEAARQELEALEAERSAAQSTISEARRLRKEVSEAATRKRGLENEIASLESAAVSLNEERGEAEASRDQVAERNEQLAQQRNELQARIAELSFQRP